jgi:hypothetical protein
MLLALGHRGEHFTTRASRSFVTKKFAFGHGAAWFGSWPQTTIA